MSLTSSDALGWYGKIPALGDFASRRLPEHFLTLWDTWLQYSIASSRELLAEQWVDRYLTSPIWRFALAPDVCGDGIWAGILMPSVDNVGRHFPLTLAQSIDPPCGLAAVLAAQTWYDALETIALSVLRHDGSLDDLERDIRHLSIQLEAEPTTSAQTAAGALAAWWETCVTEPLSLRLDGMVPMQQLADAAMHTMFESRGRGRSIWWSSELDTGVAAVHCCVGLPPHDYFVSFLR